MIKKNKFSNTHFIIVIIAICLLLFIDKINLRAKKEVDKVSSENIIEQNCNLKTIKEIPLNSIIISGHNYSNDDNTDSEFLNDKLINFINSHHERLKLVILNGDIFHHPSLKKWYNLKIFFKDLNLDFMIAPGNHDVFFGDNSLRDVFNQSFNFTYPLKLDKNISNRFNFHILDSTSNLGLPLLKLHDKDKDHVIIQHHSPVSNFKDISNSLQHLDIPKIDDLKANLQTKITFILGDFGIYYGFFCFRDDNLRIIGSGLGGSGRKFNEILIFHNDEFFRYILD